MDQRADLALPRYRDRVAAGRRARARPLRRLAVAAGILILVGAVAGPFLLRPSDALPGNAPGLALWRFNNDPGPWLSQWDGSGFTVDAPTAALGEWRIIRGAVSSSRDEAIVVGIAADKTARGQMWNGSTWSPLGIGNPLASLSHAEWWGVDAAYERSSGDAMVVWGNGSSGTQPLSYATWGGSGWNGPHAITTPLASEAWQIDLAPSPDSDEMVLVVGNKDKDSYALVWDGSAWGDPATLFLGSGVQTDIAVAYEQQSGRAVVFYGEKLPSAYARVWNGSVWLGPFPLTPPPVASGDVEWITVEADPGSDRILAGFLTSASDIWFGVWDGGTWGDRLLATDSANTSNTFNMAVAVESQSGHGLAVWGVSGQNAFSYASLTGSGWGTEQIGPDIGSHVTSLIAVPARGTDEIMIGSNDEAKGANFTRFDGATLGPAQTLSTDTGDNKYQPLFFLWQGTEPPTFDQDRGNRTDPEGTAISFGNPATDPEGDPLTWSATGLPPGLSIAPVTGTISGMLTSTAAQGSPYAVTLRVQDGSGGFDLDTFTWTVTNTPVAPTVVKESSAGGSVLPGDRITYKMTVTNVDDQPHIVAVADPVPSGTTYVAGSSWVSYPTSSTDNVRDDFNAASFSNSNGSLPWASAWQELGESNGPAAGEVRISFGDLNLFDTGFGVMRRVDLSAFSDADLSYRVGTNGLGDGTMLVEASPDAAAWTTIDTVTAATGVFTHTLDIDAFTGAEAYVRYRIVGGSTIFQINVDYIDITGTTGGGFTTVPGGPPPALASGITLAPGEMMELAFEVDVDASPGVPSIDNTVSVSTDLVPGPTQASVSDPVDNRPPVADAAGPYTGVEGGNFQINGSGSTDPDGDSLAYEWDLDGDGVFGDITGAMPLVSWPLLQGLGIVDDGTYPIALRVSDGKGGFDTDASTFEIRNTVPTLWAVGTGVASIGTPYSIDLHATDPGDDTVSEWRVDWGDGSISLHAGAAPTATHTYTASAVRPILIAATDDDGTWVDADLVVPSFQTGSTHLGLYAARIGSSIADLGAGSPVQLAHGVTTGPDGLLYVTSYWNGLVLRFDPFTRSYVDTFVPGADPLTGPAGIAFGPGGDLFVADYDGHVVRRYDGATGASEGVFVSFRSGGLRGPGDLAFGPGGDLLVAGYLSGDIHRYRGSDGASLGSFVTGGSGGLTTPEGLVFGPDGSLYVASMGDDRVLRFDGGDGSFLGEFVASGSGGLDQPAGIAFDASGDLYVSSQANDSVKRYDGASGGFVEDFVSDDGPGGLDAPAYLGFLPDHLVVVASGPVFDQDLGDRSDPENETVSVSASATDPDGDPVTYGATGLPPGLSIDPSTGLISGSITFDGAAGSPYAVEIEATDSGGAPATDTFTWTVTEVNRAPVVSNPSDRSNNENQSVTFAMSGSDPDGDGLTWTSTGLPDGLSIDPGSGVISGTLSYVSAGTHPVTIRATDPGLLFDEVGFTWTVGNVNRGPSVDHPGHQTVAEGEVFSLVVTATDPDGDGITWSATALPPGLSIDPITGEISGTVAFGSAASSPFNSFVRATDDAIPSAGGAALVTWTVTDTNRPPVVANPGDQSDSEGDPITVPVAGNDPDGDAITWSAVGLPDGVSINPFSGVISGILTHASAGFHAVTVAATDDGTPVEAASVGFTWTVADVNRPPTVTSPGDQSDAEGDAVSLPVTGSDPDGDGLAWTAAGLPPGLVINPSNGTISGTLSYASAGIHPVSVRATDDGAGSLFDETAFTWTVGVTNRAPVVADPGPQATREGNQVLLAMSALDPDGDGFTWSAAGLPPGLAIDPATGEITGDVAYDASAGSPHMVIVTATDDGVPQQDGQAVFTWTITDVNLAPTITDPGAQVSPSGGAVALPMTAVDPEGGSVNWSAVGLPAGLVIDPLTGLVGGVVTAPPGTVTVVTIEAVDDGVPAATGVVQFKWLVSSDLLVTKVSDAGGVAAAGQAITFTITVQNPGPVTHTGIAVTDPVPAGTTWVSTSVTYPSGARKELLADGWDTAGYSGSTGTIPWAGPWVETGDDGDPDGGQIRIHEHDGVHLIEIEEGAVALTRSADLSAYVEGYLSYRFRRQDLADAADVVVVEMSSDGSAWTEVARHAGPGDDEWQVKAPIDVSEFLSPATAIRFRSLGSHDDGELRVDWVEIVVVERTTATEAGGAPPAAAAGIDLLPGEAATVTMTVVVDDPLDRSILAIDNTATITSDQQAAPGRDTTSDAVNHRPLFDQDRLDRSDGEGGTVSLINPATDPNGDPLTWSAVGLPNGLAIDPASGTVSGTIGFDAAASSPFSVTLRVEDPAGTFDTDDFTWTITQTNRSPAVASPGDLSGAEGDAIDLALSGTDPDGDGLTWSAAGLPAGLAIDPASGTITGTIAYTAAASSPYAVTVRATDDGSPNLFDEASFTWTVGNTNRPPVVTDPGPQSSAEADSISLPMAATDPDGDGLVWSAAGLPDGLAIEPASGAVSGTITYDASASSPYIVTIRATDGGSPNLFDEVVFQWVVSDTNRPPSIDPPLDQADSEGDGIGLTITGGDPDGDGFSWTASGLPPGLLIGGATGQITGTISYDAAGTYTVTVRLTDDRIPGLFDKETFTWDVGNTNRPPTIDAVAGFSDAEGDAVAVGMSGSDPDGDGLTWTAAGLPPGLAIDPATGEIGGTIPFDASPGSPYSVSIRATDDGIPALFAEESFDWAVADTNRAPVVASPGDRASGEADVIALDIPASDPDGDGITWAAAGLPPGLAIDPSTGAITGTVSFDAAASSPYAVSVTVTDEGAPALTTPIAFSWAITDTNRAPLVAAVADQSSDEGAPVWLPVSGSDPDGHGLGWAAAGLPPGLSIDPSSGVIAGIITHDAADDSPFIVMITATDDGSPVLWSTVFFSWTVADVNRPPAVVSPGDQISAEGEAVSVTVAASDPDDDGLSFAAEGLPAGLSIDSATGVISGSAAFDQASASPYTVTVTVTDDRDPNLSDQAAFTWTVVDTNRAPRVDDPGDQVGDEDRPAVLEMEGIDPDGDGLDWSATGLPPGLRIDAGSGVILGTFESPGVFSVTVIATDDGSPSLAASVGFLWTVIAAEPVAPVIEPLPDRSDLVGDEIEIRPEAESPDGETLSWAATGLPAGISIDPDTGLISGTLTAPGVSGVEIVVTDPRDLGATAGFAWTIGEGMAIDEPPRAADDGYDVVESSLDGGAALLEVLANDADPEGSALRIVRLGDVPVGEAWISAETAITFKPPGEWLGTTSFSYVVADAAGNTDTARVTVTIRPDLEERAAGATLIWQPPTESRPTAVVGVIRTPETQLVLGSIVQSLHVLRMPLTLLGGAVLWSLLLGGAFNLTLLLRSGMPFLARGARLRLAIVLAGHGQKVPAHAEPGEGEVIHRFVATDKAIAGTGRNREVDGVLWTEVDTPAGRGWVEAGHLTEELDSTTFADDPAPALLLEDFVETLRSGGDPTPFVSRQGLWVSHHDQPIGYPADTISGLLAGGETRVWPGRNPAFADVRGTFGEVVASGVVEAWDRPDRLIGVDRPSVPSTIVPVEYTNFHSLSIGTAASGRERLDQTAWLAHFSYEKGTPYLVALTREG